MSYRTQVALLVGSPKARVARARRSAQPVQGRTAYVTVLSAPGWQITCNRLTLFCLGQVDTLGKKLLVGVAFGYLALVLVVPTLNVFVQVRRCFRMSNCS